MISIAATVLTHPDTQVRLLYGNRTTGSVITLVRAAAKRPASAGHLRPLPSDPTERDRTAFARAPAWEKFKEK